MLFTATTTGSKSARLGWDASLQPGGLFQVYRGLTAVFGSAAAVGAPAASSVQVYNDYALAPSTVYYYWLKDQNNAVSGPQTITTADAVVDNVGLDEAQMGALYDWAYGAHNALYPVDWRYQPATQSIKPRITLNVTGVRRPGFNDDLRADNEALGGARIATVSVAVSSDPQPPVRGLVDAANLTPGTYTLTVGGVDYPAVMAGTFSATDVANALAALLQAAGFTTFLYGADPASQGLVFEAQDPRAPMVVTASANLTASTFKPPKALAIAQRLQATLGSQFYRDGLEAAGIGVGTVNDVNDISAMLETREELRAQFDFFINLAATLAVSSPIIDTVTPPSGTYN